MYIFSIITLIFSILSFSNSNNLFQFKCSEEKSTLNVCAFTHIEKRGNSGAFTQSLIFNKCKKGKICSYGIDNGKRFGVCVNKIKKVKNGKKCNYDEDCITGVCTSGKCTGILENESCSLNSPYRCGTGLACAQDKNNNMKFSCQKLLYAEGSQPPEDAQFLTVCAAGFSLSGETDDNSCHKFGSLENEKIAISPYLCKSGISRKLDSDYICDSIEEEPVCEDGKIIKNGKWASGVIIENDDTDTNDLCVRIMDSNGKMIDYFKGGSTLKTKFFNEFIEKFNELDFEKINQEDKYASFDNTILDGDKIKWKIYKNFLIYEIADELKALGLINEEGEINDDKDCEFEYIIKHLSSYYLNINILMMILFFLLIR